MTMPAGSGQEAGATSTTTPDAGSNPEGYTVDELREQLRGVLDEELGPRLARLQGQFDSRITGLEMLRPQLEEVVGTSRKTDLLLQRVFSEQMTPEDRAAIDQALKTRATEEELTWRRKQAERPAEPTGPTAEQIDARDFDLVLSLLRQDAEAEGLDWKDVEPMLGKAERKYSQADPRGWASYRRNVTGLMKAEADRQQAEQKARVEVPSAKGGGTTEKLDSISLIKRGLSRGV